MSTRSTIRLLLVASVLAIAGCGDSSKLQDFVSQAQFPAPAGGVLPTPVKPVADVYRFASNNYLSDAQVRRLLANNFLRYDSALLDKGLIAVEMDPGDLIWLLWEKESPRYLELQETPSTARMRNHIERDSAWFALGSDELNLLRANKSKLQNLQQAWQQP